MAVAPSRPVPNCVTREEFSKACPRDLKCNQIMHVGVDSCLKAAFIMGKGSVLGAARFFLPIYLAYVCLRWKHLSRRYLQQVAWGFCRSIVFGFFMAVGFIGSSCLLRRLIGYYQFYTTVMIPGAIGGLAIFLDDPNRRSIVVNTYCNMALEYIVKKKRWRLSRLKETSFFMLINALLMYQLRTAKDRSDIFWFFVPPRRTIQTLGQCCPHTGACWKDIIKGSVKFAAFAVVLQLVRILLAMGGSAMKRPKKVKDKLISGSTARFSLSVGCYALIYKTITCFLRRRYGEDRPVFAAIGGLLAGSSHAIEPRLDAVCSASVALITLLLRRGIRKSWRNFPFGELILAACNGLFFQARCMDAAHCPPFITNMMDSASNGRSLEIYDVFLEKYEKAVADGIVKRDDDKPTSNGQAIN